MKDRNGVDIRMGDTVRVHLAFVEPVGTVVRLGEYVYVEIPNMWSEGGGMCPENVTVLDPMDIGL